MQATKHGPHRHGYRAVVFILAVHRWHAPDRTAHFSYGFSSYGPHSCSLRYAGINSVFYAQSPLCSSFSLELYIYKFISYTLLYIEETEVLSLHSGGFFW